MNLVIRQLHVLLGGEYHGKTRFVTKGATHTCLARKKPLDVAFDDARRMFRTVLYVRARTARGDVFVCSDCGATKRAALIREYEACSGN